MKKLFWLISAIIVLIALAGVYKFDYLPVKPGYDVDGNKIETLKKT